MDDGMQFAEQLERQVSYRAVATRYFGKEKLNYSIPTWDLETAKADMAKMAERKVSERDRKYVETDFVYEGLSIEVTELDGSVHPLVEESEAVEQNVEAPKASTDMVVTGKPAPATKTYMEWSKVTHRYEAEIGGKLYCVDEAIFADRFYAACKESPTDDEYRIWGVLTWLSSWDFSDKQKGAHILSVAHA